MSVLSHRVNIHSETSRARKAEETLRRRNEGLERCLAARTRELAEATEALREAMPAAEAASPADSLFLAKIKPLCVLLTEDDLADQHLVDCVLRSRGHRVEVAGEGAEAVYLCEHYHYDLMLMNVRMPDMDGLEVTAAIRRREGQGPRMPIIAVTACATPDEGQRCLEAGIDAYLAKPLSARELICLVEGLARAAGHAEADTITAPPSPEVHAAARATAPVFDPELALARCFDSEQMVRTMAETFFSEWEELMPQMRAALAKGALAELGQLGHRLKGTVAYLGAQPATDSASSVERFSAASAEDAVCNLETQCAALKTALRAHGWA